MTLELIPNGDLIFKGPFNVVSTTALKLSNSGSERLAYKIKTTAPKRYCVKPNSGFLEPNATASVQVMLQPQPAGQPDDRTKHKFMVQWVNVPNNSADDVETFWKQDLKGLNVQDSKLKCVFAEEPAAAVVPNDSHGQGESNLTTARGPTESTNSQQTNASSSPTLFSQRSTALNSQVSNPVQSQNQNRQQETGDDKSRLKQDIDRLKKENEDLKDQLKQQDGGLRQRTTGGNTAGDRGKSNQSQKQGLVLFGITLTQQLVLVAFVVALLFGFSLGYFLFSCSS